MESTKIFDSQQGETEEVEFCGKWLTLPKGRSEKRDGVTYEEDRPEGESAKRHRIRYQELTVLPTEVTPGFQALRDTLPSIEVASIDKLGRECFDGVERLNIIQSVVYEEATTGSRNMLVCAPTGSGKTNIAMLAILKVIREATDGNGEIRTDEFKIVYVAPMRALTSEIASKFQASLQRVGLKVRRVTGEETPSRRDLELTQVLVVTPEKWDVLTRRMDAWASFLSRVRLLVLDEVHLLGTDRGPVLEGIVARNFIESDKNGAKWPVRIVGLSATLPNYRDVAKFLRVPDHGLFFFDQRFRAVPLTQSFIGINVSGMDRQEERMAMDRICYEQSLDFIRRGQQVIVFVHSRSGTMELCNQFSTYARSEALPRMFKPNEEVTNSPGYRKALQRMGQAKMKELRENLPLGLAFHHAGVTKRDRQFVEQQFTAGHIRVLFSTATLSWGVNLPAHVVIIRGTDIYSHQRGVREDMDALDVQQIFGRAGRPQYDTSGHGILITAGSKVTKYLQDLNMQVPIESQLPSRLRDMLNAEIARGAVTNLDDASRWLTYTYFFLRCKLNPLAYGITLENFRSDPELKAMRSRMCYEAAHELANLNMIEFNAIDKKNHYPLRILELGMIAYRYFVSFDTMQVLMTKEGPLVLDEKLDDRKALGLISSASEFLSIQTRENDFDELERLSSCALRVVNSAGLASTEGKVNCLLQSYISRAEIEESSLVSDLYIIADSAPRISRALFEIALYKRRARSTQVALRVAKMIHLQSWQFDSPLAPLLYEGLLEPAIMDLIRMEPLSFDELLSLDASELGRRFNCHGKQLFETIRFIPRVEASVSATLSGDGLCTVRLRLTPRFVWHDKLLGSADQSTQRFWIFVEDADEDTIIRSEKHYVSRMKASEAKADEVPLYFHVNPEDLDHVYQVRVASDCYLIPDVIVALRMVPDVEVANRPEWRR